MYEREDHDECERAYAQHRSVAAPSLDEAWCPIHECNDENQCGWHSQREAVVVHVRVQEYLPEQAGAEHDHR